MTIFRILQASDLHLAVKPYQYGLPDSWWDVIHFRCPPALVSSQDPDLQKAFALFAATTPFDGIDYDVLVLSGDLATTGQLPDLQVALTFVNSPAPSGLGGSPATIPLIPGNHDRFGPPPAGIHHPGNRNFDTIFGHYWSAGAGGVQPLWQTVKNGIQLVLIGADFTLAANDSGNWMPFGWCGQGRAYAKRVSALRQATIAARQAAQANDLACTVVWVIHFMPFQSNDWVQLLDAFRLLAAARNEGIPVVLCGHTHEPSQLVAHPTAPGTQFCLCGSTTQYHQPGGNFLNLLDLVFPAPNAALQVNLQSFRYDPFAGVFR